MGRRELGEMRMVHAGGQFVGGENPKQEASMGKQNNRGDTVQAPPVILAEGDDVEQAMENLQADISGLAQGVVEVRASLDEVATEEVPQEVQDEIVRLAAAVAKLLAEHVEAAKEKDVSLGTNAAGEKREIIPEVPVIRAKDGT